MSIGHRALDILTIPRYIVVAELLPVGKGVVQLLLDIEVRNHRLHIDT